ncbi:hypothetical protein LCGC14_2305760 [marine sediment metagenome]|uniref:Uncharacterized protein n=1 Tax=marine sediment metagenome TaxID=412755 RepID=A0A0F9CM54_9ZZZZ
MTKRKCGYYESERSACLRPVLYFVNGAPLCTLHFVAEAGLDHQEKETCWCADPSYNGRNCYG